MSPNPGIWAWGCPGPEVSYFSKKVAYISKANSNSSDTSHSSSTSNSNSTSNGNTNSSSTCICIWLYVYAFVFVFAFICVFLYVYVYVYVKKTIYVYDYVDIIVLLNMIVCRDVQKTQKYTGVAKISRTITAARAQKHTHYTLGLPRRIDIIPKKNLPKHMCFTEESRAHASETHAGAMRQARSPQPAHKKKRPRT